MAEAIVGIPLPREVAQKLAHAQGGLETGEHVEPEAFMLLLAELGDQPEDRLQAVRNALDAVSSNVFYVEVEGLGTLGGAAPTRVYAEVKLTDPLKELHRQVGAVIRDAGVPLPYQGYTPQIPLAHFGALGQFDLRQIMSFVSRRAGLRAGPFPVTKFALYAVREDEGGELLEQLADYPLSGRLIRA